MVKQKGQERFLTCSLNTEVPIGLAIRYQVSKLLTHNFFCWLHCLWLSNFIFYLFERTCFSTRLLTNLAGLGGFPRLLRHAQITGVFSLALEASLSLSPRAGFHRERRRKRGSHIKSWAWPKKYYSIFCRSSYVTISTIEVNTNLRKT